MATTFMNLDLPTPTVTLGPEWATDLNTAIETIDSHDHTSGKGTQVPTAGLNINENLDFNSKKPFSLLSTQYINNGSTLTGASNASSVYVSSGDLYFTNSGGVAIQITSGGALASTPGNAQLFETTSVAGDIAISASDTFVYLIVDTTSPRAITLPLANSVSTGRIYIIKDASGQSYTNNITVNVSGSDTIDNESSLIIASDNSSTMIVGDGSSAWHKS